MSRVAALFILPSLFLASCAMQPKFREDARVLAARGSLETWEERHDTAAKHVVFPAAKFQPGDAPKGRVELCVWDDMDLPCAHGLLRVNFPPQGLDSDGPLITWVRLFDAEGKQLAEAHPWDHANKDKDQISAIRGKGEAWKKDAYFELPKRITAEAARAEVYLDGFFKPSKG